MGPPSVRHGRRLTTAVTAVYGYRSPKKRTHFDPIDLPMPVLKPQSSKDKRKYPNEPVTPQIPASLLTADFDDRGRTPQRHGRGTFQVTEQCQTREGGGVWHATLGRSRSGGQQQLGFSTAEILISWARVFLFLGLLGVRFGYWVFVCWARADFGLYT
ncbi:uncharacterized protein [Gossypium hirsutum]|uniref:Uncharacterized protein n=1 Tax=Gossypium hirsutum TaxID=3635 RepID=A0ABM3B7Z0_GOSHI|nr:uncharacterized protein LOC121224281 [Gossypium hirsutum]